MASMLTFSIWSGRRITKKGKYRIYPIAGTIILTLGLGILAVFGVGLHVPTGTQRSAWR